MLLKLHFERFTRRCAEVSRRTEAEIRERYVEGNAKHEFEWGRMKEKEFFGEMRDWLGWPADRMDELKYFWADIFSEMPGARVAIARFRTWGHVWILSDTDPVHVDFIRKKYPWSLKAQRVLTSFERGMSKRETGAFLEIVQAAGKSPEDILFIDDKQANIDAALEAGIDARLFRDWKSVFTSLVS